MLNRVAAIMLAGLVLVLFFYRSAELPLAHGDERSFLSVPYRFTAFGDLRYPVFMSDSFGAPESRPYPPVNALALRSLIVRAVGFSARNSRYVSAALILTALLAAGFLIKRALGLSWPLAALALAPAALAPTVIIAARTTRLEQETFFFGALSAFLLASGFAPKATRGWLAPVAAGAFASFAAGIHPFGLVYCAAAPIALIAIGRLRVLSWWIAGAAIGASPTLSWMASKGQDLASFAAVNGAMYAARTADLTEWMAAFESVSWLRALDLPQWIVARIAAVQHCAFSDYVGFPMEPGGFSVLLRSLFWIEAFVIGWYLLIDARRARPHGVTVWLCLLAATFLVFSVGYVPNTTYGLYGAFHVHLAFAAVCFCGTNRAALKSLFFGVAGAFIVGGLVSAFQLLTSSATLTLDEDMAATAEVARMSGIDVDDVVMTSTESWAAAGRWNTSLQERIQYGLGHSAHDGLVYRRANAEFFRNAGLPREPAQRAVAIAQRDEALRKIHEGLTLTGLLIFDDKTHDAVYFFSREPRPSVVVATIAPRAGVTARDVALGSASEGGPGLACDHQALPLCKVPGTENRRQQSK